MSLNFLLKRDLIEINSFNLNTSYMKFDNQLTTSENILKIFHMLTLSNDVNWSYACHAWVYYEATPWAIKLCYSLSLPVHLKTSW
jgi:hypothetical protein